MNKRYSIDKCEADHLVLVALRTVGGFLIGFGWLYLFIIIAESI